MTHSVSSNLGQPKGWGTHDSAFNHTSPRLAGAADSGSGEELRRLLAEHPQEALRLAARLIREEGQGKAHFWSAFTRLSQDRSSASRQLQQSQQRMAAISQILNTLEGRNLYSSEAGALRTEYHRLNGFNDLEATLRNGLSVFGLGRTGIESAGSLINVGSSIAGCLGAYLTVRAGASGNIALAMASGIANALFQSSIQIGHAMHEGRHFSTRELAGEVGESVAAAVCCSLASVLAQRLRGPSVVWIPIVFAADVGVEYLCNSISPVKRLLHLEAQGFGHVGYGLLANACGEVLGDLGGKAAQPLTRRIELRTQHLLNVNLQSDLLSEISLSEKSTSIPPINSYLHPPISLWGKIEGLDFSQHPPLKEQNNLNPQFAFADLLPPATQSARQKSGLQAMDAVNDSQSRSSSDSNLLIFPEMEVLRNAGSTSLQKLTALEKIHEKVNLIEAIEFHNSQELKEAIRELGEHLVELFPSGFSRHNFHVSDDVELHTEAYAQYIELCPYGLFNAETLGKALPLLRTWDKLDSTENADSKAHRQVNYFETLRYLDPSDPSFGRELGLLCECLNRYSFLQKIELGKVIKFLVERYNRRAVHPELSHGLKSLLKNLIEEVKTHYPKINFEHSQNHQLLNDIFSAYSSLHQIFPSEEDLSEPMMADLTFELFDFVYKKGTAVAALPFAVGAVYTAIQLTPNIAEASIRSAALVHSASPLPILLSSFAIMGFMHWTGGFEIIREMLTSTRLGVWNFGKRRLLGNIEIPSDSPFAYLNTKDSFANEEALASRIKSLKSRNIDIALQEWLEILNAIQILALSNPQKNRLKQNLFETLEQFKIKNKISLNLNNEKSEAGFFTLLEFIKDEQNNLTHKLQVLKLLLLYQVVKSTENTDYLRALMVCHEAQMIKINTSKKNQTLFWLNICEELERYRHWGTADQGYKEIIKLGELASLEGAISGLTRTRNHIKDAARISSAIDLIFNVSRRRYCLLSLTKATSLYQLNAKDKAAGCLLEFWNDFEEESLSLEELDAASHLTLSLMKEKKLPSPLVEESLRNIKCKSLSTRLFLLGQSIQWGMQTLSQQWWNEINLMPELYSEKINFEDSIDLINVMGELLDKDWVSVSEIRRLLDRLPISEGAHEYRDNVEDLLRRKSES